MNKRIIAVICVMLVLTFVFVGCTKTTYYTDKAGNKHIAYTDENGETVTDKSGAVLIVPTDNSGEQLTDKFGQPVTQVAETTKINTSSDGKSVETVAYTMDIPSGWTLYSDIDDYAQLRYGDEKSRNMIDIKYYTQSYDEVLAEVEKTQKDFSDGIAEQKGKVLIDTKEKTTLKNGEITPVTKFVFLASTSKDGKDVTAGYVFYVFEAGNFTYAIPCTVFSEDEIKSIDFEAVINAINFK